MNPSHLQHLACPTCEGPLSLTTEESVNGRVRTGVLTCPTCHLRFPIRDFIPRFVSDERNYAVAFGYQWNRHALTQYDRHSCAPVSEKRFFGTTQWPRHMTGERLLEAGSGSGRFTEHAASTGATVISFDYSNAVDANYRNNGHFDNVLIVQASIYAMPFHLRYFAKIVCIGVIQHTPDPTKSFQCLTKMLASGGNLVVDAYIRLPWWKQMWLTKFWVRPITRRLPPAALYLFCERWVNLWWGVTGLFQKLTGRRILSWFLLIADYRGVYPLPDHVQKEWAILDSFDMLSPAYDFPMSVEEVRKWFVDSGFLNIEVGLWSQGIYGRGTNS